MANEKITGSKRFFFLNFLPRKQQVEIVEWGGRRALSQEPFAFPSFLPNTRKALFILPEDPASAMLAIPTFCAIMECLPGASAALLCAEPLGRFLTGLPGAEKVISYGPETLLLFSDSLKAVVEQLRREKFDACFCLDRALDLKRLSLIGQSGIPVRVGYAGSEGESLFNLAVRPNPNQNREAERGFALARCLGFHNDLSSFHLAFQNSSGTIEKGQAAPVGVSCALKRDLLHSVVYDLRSRGAQVLLLHSPLAEPDTGRDMESVDGVKRCETKGILDASGALQGCRGFIGSRCALTYLSAYVQVPVAAVLNRADVAAWSHPSKLFAAVTEATENAETAYKAVMALEAYSK